MATEYSRPFTITVNGRVMVEAMSVDDDVQSGDKLLRTMAKGASGHSDGATETKVSIKSAIPRAGYEADFADLCANHQTVTVSVRGANKMSTYVGRFISVKTTSSAENPNEVSAEFEGALQSRITI